MDLHRMFNATSSWKSTFPNAYAGILVMRNISNPAHQAELEKLKIELEEQLRAQFVGQDRAAIASHPVLKVYAEYYKKFKKTYHVQLQLESIVLKGKSIPSVASLVECMFMAEMKNFLLTAVHDLDKLQLSLTLDVTQGTESYTVMRGTEQTVKAGDMTISDQAGIISNIIYGPDQRTQISESTRNVVFTVYAPAGIDEQLVMQHLQDMRDYVLVIAPQAEVELIKVYGA
ncbi:MAG TPA: phenylalanine--tRNA ligase beta subunit-related protein [Anaerolineales bacterium]|jgi:DNA/RNA-binding domain of Phe-tRNA-synthetase-like protein|nr:phenylalanine--tRNA ligase beta subunit-related protein [Anaerolineales bacterium]